MNYDLFYKSINTTNTEDVIKNLNYEDIQNEDNYTKSERADFTVASHYKNDMNQIYEGYMEAKSKSIFRREEWICKLLFGKTFNSLGKIVDYQVPLKSEKTDDGKGKIDLLSFNSKTQTAYIIEVKIDTSTESPLKAFLEVNTYFHQLPDYFLKKSKALGAKQLKKAVLICYDSETADRKGYIVNKLLLGADDYNAVINSLDIELYKATLDDSCKEKVTDISKWHLKRVGLGVSRGRFC